MEGTGPVMDASEEDTLSDPEKPPSPVYIAVDALLQQGL
jgi:hypothetical protein